MQLKQNWQTILKKPVSIAPIVTFRIVFGLLVCISTIRFVYLGWINEHYINPVFHFKYDGFHWLPVFSPTILIAIHIVLIICSVGICLGLFYRTCVFIVFICFTYTELIDLTYYLNHYYFVSCICFILFFIPANKSFSLDNFIKKQTNSPTIPLWCLRILQLQIAIVYVYAGLAKINYTWLIQALPLKIWLPAATNIPIIGNLFSYTLTPYLFSWIGMLYDTTIILWLALPRTRVLAFISVIIFHVLTGILFQIGVFPLVMIFSTLLFFSSKWHLKMLNKISNLIPIAARKIQIQAKPIKIKLPLILILFMVFQIVFPWRFLAYPGSLMWTEQGYRFSWRVMLMEKAGTATFYIHNQKTKHIGQVFNSDFLNTHQEKQMAMQPDMILQYANFLGNYYSKNGTIPIKVTAEVYVTLNGKPSKLLFPSTLNLLSIKNNWKNKSWLNSAP